MNESRIAQPQTLVADAIERIEAPDARIAEETQTLLDFKTKPRRSLAGLEDLACKIAAIRGTSSPGRPEAAIVVVAADHGFAEEGVSAYPQEVTAQMLANFAGGGAAICVLAKAAGAHLVVVDAGTATPFDHPDVLSRRIGDGTANAAKGPAMSQEQAYEALASGVELARQLSVDGIGIVGLGDMGIANTTSAAALAAALIPAEPSAVCGKGTGIDDDGVARKVKVVRASLAANAEQLADPVSVLAAVGGFEIGTLAGVVIGAAANAVPVIIDGFITAAAALVACRIAPVALEYLIAGHRSAEPGHSMILDSLGLKPLLELGMRLGEGSGAALAIPIVDAALAVLADMATFEDAGVTDAGA